MNHSSLLALLCATPLVLFGCSGSPAADNFDGASAPEKFDGAVAPEVEAGADATTQIDPIDAGPDALADALPIIPETDAKPGVDAAPARNVAGTLDPSFGTEGVTVLETLAARGAFATAALLQTSRAIVLMAPRGATPRDARGASQLLRLDPYGALDGTFEMKPPGGLESMIALFGMGEDSGGVAVGRDGCVARYMGDGSLDATYGDGGKRCVPGFYTAAAAQMRNGGILIVGASTAGPPERQDIRMARFTTRGELDTTFGAGGIVTTQLGRSHSRAWNVVEVTGKRVQLAVVYQDDANRSVRDAVVRFDVNGVQDLTFGSQGVARGIPMPELRVRDQGFYASTSGGELRVVRLTEEGKDDPTFVMDAIPLPGALPHRLAGSQAHFVMAGSMPRGLFVARWTRDGKRDMTFGEGGVSILPLRVRRAELSRVDAIAFEPRGIILTGNAINDSGQYCPFVARLHP